MFGISIKLTHGGLQVWDGLTLTKPSEMDTCVNLGSQFINLLMKNTAVVLADPGLLSLYVSCMERQIQRWFNEKPEQAKFARWSLRGPHPLPGAGLLWSSREDTLSRPS